MIVNQKRSLWKYVLFTILTCGIYSWIFLYDLARDVNMICQGDGRETAGLGKLLLLSVVTFGIYGFVWYYDLGNRLQANAPRYGLTFQENGTAVLLWQTCGLLLFYIGPFIAWNIIIKNTNALAAQYNNYARNTVTY